MTKFLKTFTNSINSFSESLPILAIIDSFFIVTILSTFITELILRLLTGLIFIIISFGESESGITKLIAETIIFSYLSFVDDITTAGLTFIFVSSEKWERN